MLLVTGCDEYLYPVFKFDLSKGHEHEFLNELLWFPEQFADCFQRSVSREHFQKYIAGQFSPLERKTIDPIAFSLEDLNIRSI